MNPRLHQRGCLIGGLLLCWLGCLPGCGGSARTASLRTASTLAARLDRGRTGTPPQAASPSAPSGPAGAADSRSTDAESARAWLYRVSGDGTPAPSFILGTLHVGVALPRALPSPLDRTLLDARTVIMEIDLAEAQRYLERPSSTPSRSRVRPDHALSRETWTRLTSELSLVATPEQLAHASIGTLASYLRQVRMADVEAEDDGWPHLPGTPSTAHLDRWIYDWATQWCVPFVPLETPEQTIDALAPLPASPLEALRRMIDDPEGARTDARRLRDAYLSLDESRVAAVIAQMTEAERTLTFAHRNRAWMERLVPEMRGGAAFVAVGLGHLVGPQSLLALLRERGFTVERVIGDGELPSRDPASGYVWSRAPRQLL